MSQSWHTNPLLHVRHLLRRPPHIHSCCPPPLPPQNYILIPHHVQIIGDAIVEDFLEVTMVQSGRFEQGINVYQGIGISKTG